ncbi:hypothetical protein AFK68_06280 [Hydrocoleum sp. CS-953]|uniref:DUF2834 domain-containing protein n=1 Tax=Hydrocoleum sp. CS-953 TaxID=1671698 RepID=UPI000B9C4F93|nr:DUF2834 domain-containing protein [Hydrocoleum sp. CS-953]OZH55173.1 hypothetical protein AFK68_06280 [Hydrocoleum sp. CS-953]
MSKTKIAFWLLWIGFSVYAFLLAPPDQPDTLELIQKLSTGEWENINPLIISLFNIMGILPLIYSCLLFFDGREQKVPAWLFSTLSFGVGAFAILPYLGLRQPNPNFSGKKNLFLNILDSRILGIALTLGTSILLIYGLKNGDWENFIQQWQSSRFIHVMSLDFCMLCLLFPTLLGDDMSRRGMEKNIWYWVALVPLLGPLIYLSVRSPLLATDISIPSDQQQATFNN